MDEITTNRDFYRAITQVQQRHAERDTTLEAYLSSVRRLARAHRGAPTLTAAELARLLEAAFDSTEPSGSDDESPSEPAEGYAEWEARLDEQIRDLREMEAAGMLADEHRYYGVDAPSGARWYNFDPRTYLECATAGTLGGWQEGDDTGRELVPGPVAGLDASGELTTMDPADIEAPVFEIQALSWHDLVDFLWAGQAYE